MSDYKNIGMRFACILLSIVCLTAYNYFKDKKEKKENGPYLAVLEYEETGEFVPENMKVDIDERGGDMLGRHYLLTCAPVAPLNDIDRMNFVFSKTDKGYLYSPVKSAVTGQAFALLCDTEIPSPEKYHVLESVICGYYKQKSMAGVTSLYPLLRVIPDSYEGSLLDYSALLRNEIEPAKSVTEDDLTLTLDKLEYRGKLSRIFVTLENNSETRVACNNFSVTCDGKELCGEMNGVMNFPLETLLPYYDENDVAYFPLALDPGQSVQGIYVIETCTGKKPLDLALTHAEVLYNLGSTEDELVQIGDKHVLQLSYELPEELFKNDPPTESGTIPEE